MKFQARDSATPLVRLCVQREKPSTARAKEFYGAYYNETAQLIRQLKQFLLLTVGVTKCKYKQLLQVGTWQAEKKYLDR